MIIEQKAAIVIEHDGVEMESTEMGIDLSDMNLIMDFFSSGIYKDGPGSIIREVTSNAIDATVESGNKTPVLVSLKNNNGQWQFTVEDTGLGLSKHDINTVIYNYLTSTKRKSDDLLGCKGIGFKSPLDYKDYFQFQCRKDGKEVLCMMHKDTPKNRIAFLYEKDTTESNGVKVIVDVDYYDRSEFSRKMRTQLIYFDNVYIQDDYTSFDNTYKIYKNELFSYSKICSDRSIHLNFGGVYYPLDFDKLGIDRINVPIAINIGLTDGIEPTLSREDIRYTIHAKEFIKNKIKLIADWFITEYNKTQIEYDNFIDAKYKILNRDYSIILGENSVNFKDLLEYSELKCENITVKGYNNTDVVRVAKNVNTILNNIECIAKLEYNNRFTTKNSWRHFDTTSHKYIVNHVPIGNEREYIREYFDSGYFFKLPTEDYKLWFWEEGKLNPKMRHRDNSWYEILDLYEVKDKSLWRPIIQDAIKVREEYIVKAKDLRELKIPQEWFNKKKQQRKYEGKILDKQDGEITYFFTRSKEYGGQMFDKKTMKISELGKEKCMVVYFTPQEKEFALRMWESIFYHWTCKKNVKLKFVLINQREQKHINHLQNYKTWKEFMETNKFKKLATKFKAQNEMEKFSAILHSAEFSTILDTIKKNKKDVTERVNKYVDEVPGSISQYAINDMLKMCEENNLWDYSIMSDIEEVSKLAKEFEFLQVLKVPNRWGDEENKTKFAKYVAQFILFNKLYKNDFEQFEICVKAPIEETILINEGELIPENVLEYDI